MKYTTIFFDLDNTLLDFYKAEHDAIKQLFLNFNLPNGEDVIKLYSNINHSYWKRFEKGEIRKDEIFVNRFKTLTETLGKTADCEKMAADYLTLLSNGHDLIDGAEDILKYLKGRGYKIYATTNGDAKTQYKRIADSGLGCYFDDVFLSETIGHQKPEEEYFSYVIDNIPEKDKEKIIIIGDSQSSDILGGVNAGIDSCWFNTLREERKYPSKYEIKSLKELENIL